MFKQENKIRFLYVMTDVFLMAGVYFLFYGLRYNYYTYHTFPQMGLTHLNLPNFREYLFVFVVWAALTVSALKRRGLYTTVRQLKIPKEIYLVLVSLLYASVLVAALIFFSKFKFFSRGVFLWSFVGMALALTSWRSVKRLILRHLVKMGFHNFNVLVIGANPVARLLTQELNRRPFLGLRVVGVLDNLAKDNEFEVPWLGPLSDFEIVCQKFFIDEVFITIPSQGDVVADITRKAKDMHLGVRIVPQDFETTRTVIELDYLGFIPLLTYKERDLHPAELETKRLFDLCASLLLLILLAPLLVVIAILIKLDSPGPLFYVQKRMGKKGRLFNFYKFRSMRQDADDIKPQLLAQNEVRDGVIFKMRKDPRITRIGRWLRRYSLDELPQLWNVLKGDMSLVGPRPFPVEESRQFKPNHIPRLNIKPGITGLAQIRGRSDLAFSRWVRWDLWYIKNWSFGLDLKILWQTIPTILKGRGAY